MQNCARTGLQHPQMARFHVAQLESLRLHAAEAGHEATMADEAFDVLRARTKSSLSRRRSSAHGPAFEPPVVALSNGNADLGLIGLGDYRAATARAAGVMKPDARIQVCADRAALPTVLSTSATIRTPTARATAGLTAVWIRMRQGFTR
jgi:putative hydrolase of the HAD superfamily